MSIAHFEFTPLRMNTPLDNLTAAISIIQTQVLAHDSDCKPEVMFGLYHLPTDQMQVAVALLVGMLGELESLRWRDGAPGAVAA
ncbi:hypothetical protein [Tabrizicola sp.]|uniref:hypothetical protein n=1 Tax=Tabrizicola sp. TaxID=2005166 RepID=UPI00286C80C1|nr:hypothetical protein [Tabrizicola sp.]